MYTAFVLLVIAVLWYRANSSYQATQAYPSRVDRASLLWAFLGAVLGSFFGVSGFGGAIAGTIPLALAAYFFARLLMRRWNPSSAAAPDLRALQSNFLESTAHVFPRAESLPTSLAVRSQTTTTSHGWPSQAPMAPAQEIDLAPQNSPDPDAAWKALAAWIIGLGPVLLLVIWYHWFR